MNLNKEPRFLVDFMVGRITKWLRIFGYDTIYAKQADRPSIIMQSLKENRILLTRDHNLSRKRAWKLILLKSCNIKDQLKQIIENENLIIATNKFFSRCTICNNILNMVESKESIKTLIPEYVYKTQEKFAFCANCKKVYWHGTHQELLIKELHKFGIKLDNGKKNGTSKNNSI